MIFAQKKKTVGRISDATAGWCNRRHSNGKGNADMITFICPAPDEIEYL